MAFKETKRKGFNFFRSYFDVYNELESDKDKLSFIDALINRQFLGIKPCNLKGMAKFGYISQVNSIDSQVKGFEDKTGLILTPCQPPTEGGVNTPILQVEGKVEGKVNIESRKLDFKESLFKYVGEYKKDTVKEFFEYWSEHGDKDKKMRFEKEKSFSTNRRLKTWAKNDFSKTENPEEDKGKGKGGVSMEEMYNQ
jgi:hypothetical protein